MTTDYKCLRDNKYIHSPTYCNETGCDRKKTCSIYKQLTQENKTPPLKYLYKLWGIENLEDKLE